MKQLELIGLTDEGFQQINQVFFLYSELYKAYCGKGGALRPSDQEIDSFAQAGGYNTFLPLYWVISGDEAADAATMEKARAAAERMRNAEDITAAYLQSAQEMALQTTGAGETRSSEETPKEITAVLNTLAEGQVSDVVVSGDSCYVFVKIALNTDAVLDKMFNDKLDTMRNSAAIRYNCRSYDKLDVGEFYTKLLTLRAQLQGESAGSSGIAPLS